MTGRELAEYLMRLHADDEVVIGLNQTSFPGVYEIRCAAGAGKEQVMILVGRPKRKPPRGVEGGL